MALPLDIKEKKKTAASFFGSLFYRRFMMFSPHSSMPFILFLLSRVFFAVIVMQLQLTLSNGQISTFGCPVEVFHRRRYSVAKVLEGNEWSAKEVCHDSQVRLENRVQLCWKHLCYHGH